MNTQAPQNPALGVEMKWLHNPTILQGSLAAKCGHGWISGDKHVPLPALPGWPRLEGRQVMAANSDHKTEATLRGWKSKCSLWYPQGPAPDCPH